MGAMEVSIVINVMRGKMAVYSFCNDCKHVKVKMVKGIHSSEVEEISCPARGNPFEPEKFGNGEDAKINPYACPRNKRFMEIEHMRHHGSGGKK
jgi:nitrite reductase/ring-hydroxylating ferredoxin subunit